MPGRCIHSVHVMSVLDAIVRSPCSHSVRWVHIERLVRLFWFLSQIFTRCAMFSQRGCWIEYSKLSLSSWRHFLHYRLIVPNHSPLVVLRMILWRPPMCQVSPVILACTAFCIGRHRYRKTWRGESNKSPGEVLVRIGKYPYPFIPTGMTSPNGNAENGTLFGVHDASSCPETWGRRRDDGPGVASWAIMQSVRIKVNLTAYSHTTNFGHRCVDMSRVKPNWCPRNNIVTYRSIHRFNGVVERIR